MHRGFKFSIFDLFVLTSILAVLILINLRTHDGVGNEIESSGFPFKHLVTIVETERPYYGEPYVKMTIAWKSLVLNVIICLLIAVACLIGVRLFRICRIH
ncbi:hypothetical protein CKO51_31090 [Rhodopirellula sp. SM50]|nr:hypothetical protein CKO51_31090 [Rhodopirellula sp. SM50]